eukprot:950662-Prorocentrum_minimum.AAC.4
MRAGASTYHFPEARAAGHRTNHHQIPGVRADSLHGRAPNAVRSRCVIVADEPRYAHRGSPPCVCDLAFRLSVFETWTCLHGNMCAKHANALTLPFHDS